MASVASLAASCPSTGASSLHRDGSSQGFCPPRTAKILCVQRRNPTSAAASRASRVCASLKDARLADQAVQFQPAAEPETQAAASTLSPSPVPGLSLGAALLGVPLLALALLTPPEALAEAAATLEGEVGYSRASYYASLTLFIISIPGLWSLIKRATKSKVCLGLRNPDFCCRKVLLG